MYRVPANERCDICSAPAVAHIRNVSDMKEARYCQTHTPDLWPGKFSELILLCHRLPPGNSLSRMLNAPLDSQEHQMLLEEMCKLRLLGADGACRYYLSVLTGIDHFALWNGEFLDNLREFVDAQTRGATRAFRVDADTVECFAPLLKSTFMVANSHLGWELTKEERAVELLLQNSKWSDARIAVDVPTTIKQLQHFTVYKLLRMARSRRNPKP